MKTKKTKAIRAKLIKATHEKVFAEHNALANTQIRNMVVDLINSVFEDTSCVYCGKERRDHDGPCSREGSE